MTEPTPSLLTFAPMIDSELARLVLRHHGIAYREFDHLFGLVSAMTLLHGGYGRVPLLYGAGLARSGPLRIASHYDAIAPAAHRLVPPEEPLASVATADTARFNGGFGLDVAVFTYHHLLPARAVMEPVFATPIPPSEISALSFVYGPTRLLFRILLRLESGRAADALRRIELVFDRTAKRVADGRPYLAGDRCTLGDLALLASAAPLLQPVGYGTCMPLPSTMPVLIRGVVDTLRAHPLAAFIQRIYHDLFSLPAVAPPTQGELL